VEVPEQLDIGGKKMKTLVFVVLLISVLALPAFAIEYVFTDMGRGAALGINDLGQITGWRLDPNDGSEDAFIWSKTTGFIDIGAHTGRAINNLGQVTGAGWLWDATKGLTSLTADSRGVCPEAINDHGQISGWTSSAGNYDAIVWNSPTDFFNIGIYDNPHSWAYGINEAGTVVGEFWPSPGEDHGFSWSPSSGFTDLGDFGTKMAVAWGINNMGQISGTYGPDEGRHAFLLDPLTGMIDLGTLGGWRNSAGRRINDSGWVVGSSEYSRDTARHAFLWTKETGMIDIGVLAGIDNVAWDINNSGQIVGSFFDSSGYEHIALWEPVPEPSSLFALFGGIIGLLAFRRRFQS
jgi:probable HAF family extracellular repeat protein